jgi:hypothetical protein
MAHRRRRPQASKSTPNDKNIQHMAARARLCFCAGPLARLAGQLTARQPPPPWATAQRGAHASAVPDNAPPSSRPEDLYATLQVGAWPRPLLIGAYTRGVPALLAGSTQAGAPSPRPNRAAQAHELAHTLQGDARHAFALKRSGTGSDTSLAAQTRWDNPWVQTLLACASGNAPGDDTNRAGRKA